MSNWLIFIITQQKHKSFIWDTKHLTKRCCFLSKVFTDWAFFFQIRKSLKNFVQWVIGKPVIFIESYRQEKSFTAYCCCSLSRIISRAVVIGTVIRGEDKSALVGTHQWLSISLHVTMVMTVVKITHTFWKLKNDVLGFIETLEIWAHTGLYRQLEVFTDLILIGSNYLRVYSKNDLTAPCS